MVAAQPATRPSPVHIQQGDAAVAHLYIRVFRIVVRTLLRILFRVRVKGLKNVPRTPVVIAANHLGWADPFLILCFLPVQPRIYVLGLSLDYVKDPGARDFRKKVVDSLELMVHLHTDRPLEAVRLVTDVLKRGGSLLIFPEGTWSGAQEGHLLELQHGAAHMSQVAGVPIVPIGVTGTQELWLRKTLTLRIGKPIYPHDFDGRIYERVHEMTDRLSAELRPLLPGDRSHARVKLLSHWLTHLFYE
jgi:1-acyl-sn-glycerol-3-phosphate acyltransferase